MNMRMTVKQLRFILSEAVGNEIDTRIAEFTRNIINVSEKFVNSLVADTRDAAAAKQLQKLSTDAASYAKWLLGRREPKGEQFAMLTKLCGDLAASSGFWSTPSFLNKPQHVESMQKIFRKMQSISGPLMTKTSKSGTYAKKSISIDDDSEKKIA